MQTKLNILASAIIGVSGLCALVGHNIPALIFFIIGILLYLAAYLSQDRKDKQIEKIYDFATNQEKKDTPQEPLKIIILDSKEIYKTTFEGDPVEWDKLIMALITNPFFPLMLRTKIQLQGIETFILIDLLNKKQINPAPNNITDIKTKAVALIHKEFMSDLPVEVRATILFKNYIEERA